MLILSLEASTSSAKAMYYNTLNDTFELSTSAYKADYTNDYTVFRPDSVYRLLLKLGRELVKGRSVDAVALSSAWHSVGLFDAALCPTTPMFQWSSMYGNDESRKLRRDADYVSRYYNVTGCMVNSIYPFFKLKKLSEDYKLSKYRIMGQGSYNNYRLTGKLLATDCILSGSGLLDIHTLKYSPQLLDELGIAENQLASICDYKEKLILCDEAARELGIKPGVPVVPTCADGALNQTGAGALQHGIMTFSVGTSGAIRLSMGRPLLSPDYATWCYRTPSSWLSGAATNGGTNCIEWFRRLAFDTPMDYSLIECKASNRENTPVFLPFVFGERCPGWNDKMTGGFCNLRPEHSRYDMYLGIEEGILFNLYQCYQSLIAEHGEPRRIRFSGGILHSPAWAQMCADIFAMPLETDSCEHASLMGSVVLAKERLGLISDINKYTTSPTGIIEPDASKSELYQEKYSRYLACYKEMQSQNIMN